MGGGKYVENNKCHKDMEKLEPTSIAGRNVKCAVSVENNLAVLKKLDTKLPWDPTILLLGICTQKN